MGNLDNLLLDSLIIIPEMLNLISEIAALTNANRNTLKKTLAALVKDNYIVRNGVGKASWYTSNI